MQDMNASLGTVAPRQQSNSLVLSWAFVGTMDQCSLTIPLKGDYSKYTNKQKVNAHLNFIVMILS